MVALARIQPHHACPIADASQIGEARRLAGELAQTRGLDASTAGKVAIVVNELGTNLLKHAGGGELFIRPISDGLEIIALDQGPGIADVQRALRDGYSTAGSMGQGLGAIRRLSQVFDVYSQPGRGTGLLVRVLAMHQPNHNPHNPFAIGGVMVAYPGERVCGDDWLACENFSRQRIVLADGLGHGQSASDAASTTVTVFDQERTLSPCNLITRTHHALRSTRGAAAAIAEIRADTRIVTYCGIGNITATIYDGGAIRHLVSQNGTLGHELRKAQEFTYPWPDSPHLHLPLLVMHSDGVASHWKLESYAGLVEHHPSLIAAMLYRDFKRARDDVTVVVAKERKR
jgi:anti-sigma regulatory factor (Ser/Thr protein kinase)